MGMEVSTSGGKIMGRGVCLFVTKGKGETGRERGKQAAEEGNG